MSLAEDLADLPEQELRQIIAGLTDDERQALWVQIEDASANPFYRYRHQALRFVTEGLRESTWVAQREVLTAINEHRRVVVAASHSTGKSHIASRAVAAVGTSWPSDLVRVQTTATNFRQVKGILWPYINRLHAKYKLPGEVWTTSWKIGAEEVGSGFSASPNNEASVSGFHAGGELFLVVDEGGGIHPTLGTAFNNILTGTGHALVIGNFPTDSDDTWFNRIWESDQWHQIRISAFDTPAFPRPNGVSFTSMAEVNAWQAANDVAEVDRGDTYPLPPRRAAGGDLHDVYEPVGRCTVCPPTIEAHTIARHLTDQEWVQSIEDEFGVESAYYQSRVLALPAADLVDKTLPMSWLEAATISHAEAEGVVGPVKLGADIAADGGDEFVIARMTGWVAEVVFSRAGPENQNTMDVAGVLLGYIRESVVFHRQHLITTKVQVKIDATGLGRGVADRVAEVVRNDEGLRGMVDIVPIESARKARNPDEFRNQRSEMWWTARLAIQPDPKTGEAGPLRIVREDNRDGARLLKQLNSPTWATTGTGHKMVQPKSETKADTGQSPDRADALLLVVYSPPPRKRTNHAVGPLLVGKSNPWAEARG